jgi:hypothetical protein
MQKPNEYSFRMIAGQVAQDLLKRKGISLAATVNKAEWLALKSKIYKNYRNLLIAEWYRRQHFVDEIEKEESNVDHR